jgi:DNA-binding CsgD family transcriptional regulator
MLNLPHTFDPQSAEQLTAPDRSWAPVDSGGHRAEGCGDLARRDADTLQARRMSQMLDTLDYGMLLLAHRGQVCHVNKAAWRDLDGLHPLQIEGGRLTARSKRDANALCEALRGAADRGLRGLLQLGDGPSSISVAVVPLPAPGGDELSGVAVLLSKREVCEELSVDWFARSHKLTPAETVVMKGLCGDFTPQQIADRQGVALTTIRTQIGSIRQKTGARSICALVRQVALLPPLVSVLQALPAADPAPPVALAAVRGRSPALSRRH